MLKVREGCRESVYIRRSARSGSEPAPLRLYLSRLLRRVGKLGQVGIISGHNL